MRAGLCLVLLLTGTAAGDKGAEPTTAKGWYQRGAEQYENRRFEDAVKSLTKCLAMERDHAAALDLRGSAHFMVGKFAESVADFDRQIKGRPESANGHWRRGISLYYAGKYDEGKKQFEGYEKVDTNDVENAVWHFLCAAKKDGVAKAREGVLKIGRDRRLPMMEVYDLYRGKLQPKDVLAAAKDAKLSEQARGQALFYAHLYLGIYHDLQGETKLAKEHLESAETYRIDHYMGEVPRVHLAVLAKKK